MAYNIALLYNTYSIFISREENGVIISIIKYYKLLPIPPI